MELVIEWDSAKAKSNLRKHGVNFVEAAQVFRDPLALTILDRGHVAHEERWITLGQVTGRQLIVVVHTWAESSSNKTVVRIISAREATDRECRQYEE